MPAPVAPEVIGLSHLMNLMKLAHSANPSMAEAIIADWIASLEKAQVLPQHVRLARAKLNDLNGTDPSPKAVAWNAAQT